jgi:hypothetical protein
MCLCGVKASHIKIHGHLWILSGLLNVNVLRLQEQTQIIGQVPSSHVQCPVETPAVLITAIKMN